MGSEYSVEGYNARSKSEYEAFLRDSAKIKQIKSRLNLKNPSQVNRLYSSICTGSIKFESRIGFDFEDEITEIYEKNLKLQSKKGTSDPTKRSANRQRSLEEEEDEIYSDYIKSHEKVDIIDENVDKELVEYFYNKRVKRKKLIKSAVIIVCIAVVALSVTGVVIKVSSDIHQDVVKEELDQAKRDNAFVFTTIKPIEYQTQVTVDTYKIPDILADYKDLYEKNSDLVGWITIPDTNIDYPVMQGNDNEYYLSHNFKHKNDANGAIFADMNCSIFPRSKNIILYGHHMKSGKMFANLEKYDSYDFLTNHRVFTFDTIYEHAQYEIIFVFRDYVHASDDTDFKYYEFVDVNSQVEFDSYMNELKEKSIYSSNAVLTMDDELLTLSTCDYMQANGRFVVMARKIK